MTDYHDGELVLAGGPSVRDVAVPDVPLRNRLRDAWVLAQRSAATREAYRRDVNAFFDWCDEFGFDTLRARRLHIDAYHEYLSNGGAGRAYSDATCARKLSAISSFYDYAMQEAEDDVLRNPVATVKRPKPQESDTPWLDVDELRRLFAAADELGTWEAALVRVLYYSAVRVSELCTATTADLRLVNGVTTIGVVRKGRKRERVALGQPAAEALARHLGGRTGPLFLLRGQPINRSQVAYALTRIARHAGLGGKGLTPHGLRHSAATHALQDGEQPVRVQKMLGHKRIETTMTYGHVSMSAAESPTHRLARLVEGPSESGETVDR